MAAVSATQRRQLVRCIADYYNPSEEEKPCKPCSGLTGCTTCQREFGEKGERGCQVCDTDNGYFKRANKDTTTIECTKCLKDPSDDTKGQDYEACVECGEKYAKNCDICHSEYGCKWCVGLWRFDPENLSTHTIEGEDVQFGDCKVCKTGHKITVVDGKETCDACADGFRKVDDKCVDVDDASCGGSTIRGCQFCGEKDPKKM